MAGFSAPPGGVSFGPHESVEASRENFTTYQNTSGGGLNVNVKWRVEDSTSSSSIELRVGPESALETMSADVWSSSATIDKYTDQWVNVIVPPETYYEAIGTSNANADRISDWSEQVIE